MMLVCGRFALLLALLLAASSTVSSADVSGLRIQEIAWSCRGGDANTAFLELAASAPGQTRDAALSLELTNALGTVVFDGPVAFGAHEGEAWPQGTTWLLAGSAFAAKAGFPADGPLANALQRQAGTIVLYTTDSLGVRSEIDRYSWGMTPGLPRAPYAGQSLQRVDASTFTVQSSPTPTTSTGSSGGGSCYGYVPSWAFAIDEAAFACASGQKGMRFVEVVSLAHQPLDPNVQLRVFSSNHSLLSAVTKLFAAQSGNDALAGTRFLLGSVAFQNVTGMTADRVLTTLPDSLGGELTLVGVNAGGDSTFTLSDLTYGSLPAAAVALPGAGLSVQRQSDGSYITSSSATPQNLAGTIGGGACFTPASPGLQVRMSEMGLACKLGLPGMRFIELVSRQSQPYDTRVGLRAFAANGALLFDMPAVFGSRTATFTSGRTFLLASSAFTAVTGVSPDRVLDVLPDTTGGVIQLYATGTGVLHELRYGAVSSGVALPPAGGSLVADAADAFHVSAAATPTNTAGNVASGPCFTGTTSTGFAIDEVGLGCYYGTPGTSFIEIAGTEAVPLIPASLGLRLYRADGSLLATLPGFAAAFTNTSLASPARLLCAPASFRDIAGISPDIALPVSPDTVGGRIVLFTLDPTDGHEVTLSDLRYGEAAGLLPPPGGSLQRTGNTYAVTSTPTPTNLTGQLASGTACYPYRPSTSVVVHEFATSCRTVANGASFIDLQFTTPQILDPAIGMLVKDHAGQTIADLPQLYASALFTTAAANSHWLVGTSNLSDSGNVAPDATLPAPLDFAGGTIQLYVRPVRAATTTVFFTLTYGANASVPAPDAGASMVASNAGYVHKDQPAPQNHAGAIGGHGCFGIPPVHVLLQEVGLSCYFGAPNMRYLVLYNTHNGELVDDNVGLRFRDATGAVLADLPHALRAYAGAPFTISNLILLATNGFSSNNGVTPDIVLATGPDATGGAITLYWTDPVTHIETMLQELVYGGAPGAVPVPLPGGSILWHAEGVFAPSTDALPRGRSGTIATGDCFNYRVPTGLYVHRLGLTCSTGDIAAQYIELGSHTPTIGDTVVGVSYTNAAGAVIGDVPGCFRSIALQSFGTSRSLLLAAPGFAAATGLTPDAALPAPLDTTGGTVTVYELLPTGARLVLSGVSYGSVAPATGLPAPGAALRDGAISEAFPHPANANGSVAATSACIGAAARHVRMAQVGFGCAQDTPAGAGQFLELANDDITPNVPGALTLTSNFDANSTPLASSHAGEPWPTHANWLIADPRFPSVEGGITIDDALAAPLLTSNNEALRLYQTLSPRYSRVLVDELVIASTPAAPGAGYGKSLVHGADGSLVASARPAIHNRAGDVRTAPCYGDTAIATQTTILSMSAGCAVGGPASAFILLRMSAGWPDGGLRIRLHDHTGTLTADVGEFFTGHEHDTFVAGSVWLVGPTGFAGAAAYTADVERPFLVDASGGRVELYHAADASSGEYVIDDIAWGPGTSIPAMPPSQGIGQSTAWTYASRSYVAPVNHAGSTQGSCYPGPPPTGPSQELLSIAVVCPNGDPSMRWIQVMRPHGTSCIEEEPGKFICFGFTGGATPNAKIRTFDVNGAPYDSVQYGLGEDQYVLESSEGFAYYFGSAGLQAMSTGWAYMNAPRMDVRGGAVEYGLMDSKDRVIATIGRIEYGPSGTGPYTRTNPFLVDLKGVNRSARDCPPCGYSYFPLNDSLAQDFSTASHVDTTLNLRGAPMRFHADAAMGTMGLDLHGSSSGYVGDRHQAIQSDLFVVGGLPPGTPLDVRVRLALSSDLNGRNAAVYLSPAARLEVEAEGGHAVTRSFPGLVGQRVIVQDTLTSLVHVTAGTPFRVTVLMHPGRGAGATTGTLDGQLLFEGLPRGVTLTNCRGYGAGVVPVALSLGTSTVTPKRADLEWNGARPASVFHVERRGADTTWAALAQVSADGTGTVRFSDAAIAPGGRYGYRLRGTDGAASAEAWIVVPAVAEFALRLDVPQPVTGDLGVRLSLPDDQPAEIALFDVAGRRVAHQDLRALGLGEHRLVLASRQDLSPGIYLVRLTHGSDHRTQRVVLVR
jgi:hypothetical protein